MLTSGFRPYVWTSGNRGDGLIGAFAAKVPEETTADHRFAARGKSRTMNDKVNVDRTKDNNAGRSHANETRNNKLLLNT